MKKGSYHGSSKESHSFGGCDNNNEIAARGPGKAAMRVSPRAVGMKFDGGDIDKSKPKGIKTYKEE